MRERTVELSQAEDSLRALSRRLLQIQDEEKQRIARELHDGSGQMLAALSMNLSLLQARTETKDSEAVAIVNDSIHMVEVILKELRTMSYLLHPPLLEDVGLESALRWFVEGFTQRSRIRVTVEITPDLGRLPREVEIAVFRVVQECFTNIHRHSGSPEASIQLTCEGDNLCLEVRDRGRGLGSRLQSGERFRPGVGIQGMKERARQLGGHLEVRSVAGPGNRGDCSVAVAWVRCGIESNTFDTYSAQRDDRDREIADTEWKVRRLHPRQKVLGRHFRDCFSGGREDTRVAGVRNVKLRNIWRDSTAKAGLLFFGAKNIILT